MPRKKYLKKFLPKYVYIEEEMGKRTSLFNAIMKLKNIFSIIESNTSWKNGKIKGTQKPIKDVCFDFAVSIKEDVMKRTKHLYKIKNFMRNI